MSKKVQAIIINDRKVLTVEGINENGRKDNFFISGEVKGEESELDAIKRELSEQLNLKCDITFTFTKDIGNDIKTFLIDIGNVKLTLDYEIDNVNCISDYYKPIGLNWIELSDIKSFKEFEIQYIRILLEECINNEYEAYWLESIKETYFSSQMGKVYLDNFYKQNVRNKIDSKESIKSKMISMIMALGAGILFNYFFIWDYIGISGFIFSAAIIFTSIYGIYNEVNLKKKISFLFLLPIILLSISLSIYNNLVLTALNVILIPFLIVSYLLIIRYSNIKEIRISFIGKILERVFSKAFSTLPKFFIFSKEIKNKRNKAEENKTRKNIIKGLLISIPLLIIIVLLLTSADMMFKYYVENIGDIFGEFNLMNLVGHTIVILIVMLYIFGFSWSFRYNELNYDEKGSLIKTSWEPVTIITIIFVINIAYLLFTIVQFSYLYGGGLNSLPNGLTYAEYARKGFFELILVTIINFAILLLSINLTKKDNKTINKISNISYSFLIIFTFNMLVSASYKMYLYEKTFGYTRLRIFVQAFMVLIGVILIIVLFGIWIKRIPIFKYAVIATLIVYIGLNFINVDRIIAKENILRYEETKKIDIRYLKTLSYDAMPEVMKLLKVDDDGIKNQIEEHILYKKKILDENYDNWYEFNYFKSKFLKLVK